MKRFTEALSNLTWPISRFVHNPLPSSFFSLNCHDYSMLYLVSLTKGYATKNL